MGVRFDVGNKISLCSSKARAPTDNADQRGCSATLGSCAFSSVGLIADNNSSTYHAFQAAFSRQFANGLSFLASYWWSKKSRLLVFVEPERLGAYIGGGRERPGAKSLRFACRTWPSLFDATHRFVFSGSYALPRWAQSRLGGILANGWQINTIATFSTGTPFTVYDSDNAPLQGQAPETTVFYSSRPNVLSDPNQGPHTPNQWVSASAFEQLTQQNNPGQFGNEGRNAVRGPGYASVDCSVFKNFALTESKRLQFRAEAFNLLNHANFALPENDLNSPAFGQILQAAPPRLVQLALKFCSDPSDGQQWRCMVQVPGCYMLRLD